MRLHGTITILEACVISKKIHENVHYKVDTERVKWKPRPKYSTIELRYICYLTNVVY